MSERDKIQSEELAEQEAELLPERAAMSILRTPGETPGIVPPGIGPDVPPEDEVYSQPVEPPGT
jgi:hypothetical protein